MAGRYSKQELKDKLQRSALHLVATEGIERLSTRRLSAGCGLSDPYIYQCYSDIPELLADTFLRVDCEVAELMRTVIGTQFIAPAKPVKLADVCRLLWGAYWRYLMEDPERTVFYWRYYQSGYYNRDILAVREKNFQVFTDFIVNTGKTLGLSDDAQRLAIVTMLIDDTVSAAVRIHLGYIQKDAVSEDDIFYSAFSLLLRKIDPLIGISGAADALRRCDRIYSQAQVRKGGLGVIGSSLPTGVPARQRRRIYPGDTASRSFIATTLIISKKPGNTGISRDIRTEFTTDLLLSD